MSRSPYLGWLFLAVWATWLFAFSGYLTQFAWLGAWAPDLGLALFVALAARVSVHDIGKLALCMGLARAAVTVDPPAAVLASALFAGGVLRVARSAVQVESPPIAAGLALALTLVQAAWLQAVHARLAPTFGSGVGVELAWRGAITTALAAGLLGGLLAHLPGVQGLMRRKTWAVGASYR